MFGVYNQKPGPVYMSPIFVLYYFHELREGKQQFSASSCVSV